MYLSLPLPESRTRSVTATIAYMDGRAPPMTYGLELPATGTVRDVCKAVAAASGLQLSCGVAPEQVLCVARLNSWANASNLTVYDDPKTRLSEVFSDSFQTDTVIVYAYADPSCGPASGQEQVVVHHRKPKARGAFGGGGFGGSSMNFFSAPLLLWLPPGEAYRLDQVFTSSLSFASACSR